MNDVNVNDYFMRVAGGSYGNIVIVTEIFKNTVSYTTVRNIGSPESFGGGDFLECFQNHILWKPLTEEEFFLEMI